ncbi:MAG: flagellar protein FliS [Oscillospiraceae bacterium]|jgi:flagellin-specific chaperone FliS|nr:flagellar protein FliS [Oscillospiraceae bacterium]
MTDSDSVRKYKQNELAVGSPEENYVKCVDFVVGNLKKAAVSLGEKDNQGFYNAITPAYKMWGILVDAFDAVAGPKEKGVEDFEVVCASIERKIGQILRSKDRETLEAVIRLMESIQDMWLKLLERECGAGE